MFLVVVCDDTLHDDIYDFTQTINGTNSKIDSLQLNFAINTLGFWVHDFKQALTTTTTPWIGQTRNDPSNKQARRSIAGVEWLITSNNILFFNDFKCECMIAKS